MQREAAVAAFFIALAACSVSADAPHPIEGVIKLLKDLSSKATEEGKAEEVTYAKFEKWCADSTNTLQKAVESEKLSIDSLESKVDAKTRENATLTVQISALADEILRLQASGAAADSDRTQASELYSTSDKDLETTIAAIEEALTAMKDAKTSTSALVQTRLTQLSQLPLVLTQLTDGQREALLGSQLPEVLAKGDAAAHEKKYSFKSGDVVELLKELKEKFEDDRLEGTKAETNAQNAYELAKSARNNALEAANSAKADKTTLLGAAQSEIVTATTALDATKADLKADTESLDDTTRQCSTKKGEWQERTKIRAQELKALDVAVEILAKVGGVRTAAPTNPVAPASPLSLVAKKLAVVAESSTRSPASFLHLEVVDPKARAVNLLRSEARRIHSRNFERFADEVETRLSGPFDQVNNMIQKMIFQLMNEQRDEDEHKNWCDLELQKTNTSKLNKEEKITMLNAKLTDAKASVALLDTQIKDDQDMVGKITAFMQEATDVRQTGKTENAAAIKDAKAAQEAIAQATAVLESFYKSSGMVAKEAWELLLQRGVTLPEEPSTWSAGYTGAADPAQQPDGIITVLKAVSANFAKMEADTAAQEITDQKEYQETIKSNDIEKARRSKEAEIKSEEKKRLLDKIDEMTKSLKNVNNELGAVEQYLKDLSPACIEGDSTYEGRKQARADEVEAMKQAQVILADAFKEETSTSAPATAFLAPVRRVVAAVL